jgi:hypothetical protein
MNTIEPFLVIDRPMRQMISLPTEADASAFIERENNLWSWIDDSAGHGYGQVNNAVGRYRPENWVQQFRNALAQDKKDEFKQQMRARYGGCLCAIDPEAHAIQKLGETNKLVAAVALTTIHGEAPLVDQNFLRNEIMNRIGVAHGNALLAGLDSSSLAGTKRELMESRSQIELEAQRMRLVIDKSNAEAIENAEQIKTAANAQGAAHEELFSKAEAERSEAYSKLRGDLEATATAFEIQMETQAPVAYWRKRACHYRRASRWALFFLLTFALCAVPSLSYLYNQTASHLPTDATNVPYAALFRASAFAILMTSIAFWAARILLRIFLSTRHLTTDAEERRTMITTFLALTRKSAVKDDDRKFILAALFRPGADGIVNDESAPDTMFAALMGGILRK